MSAERDFEFETYLEYYGDENDVKRIINDCRVCGNKLVHSHMSDYSNLVVEENARCPECGYSGKKMIHIIN